MSDENINKILMTLGYKTMSNKLSLFYEGEDIINSHASLIHKYSDDIHDEPKRLLKYCVPRSKKGSFKVTFDEIKFKWVSEEQCFNYPLIQFNSFVDDELISIGRRKSMYLLAFDIENTVKEINIEVLPYLVTEWGDRRQIAFKFKNRLKKTENIPPQLPKTIERFKHVGKSTNMLINPFYPDVVSYIFDEKGTSLSKLFNFDGNVDKDEYRNIIEPAIEQGREAGIAYQQRVKDETLLTIVNTRQVLKSKGEKYNSRTLVAENSKEYGGKKLARETVSRRWKEALEIEKIV